MGDLADLDVLRARWPFLCGEALARVTEPASLHDGTLEINVFGRPWLDAVRAQHRRLLARVRRGSSSVMSIRFVAQPARPAPPTPELTPPPTIPPDVRTADIDDPALRASLDALLHAARVRKGTEDV